MLFNLNNVLNIIYRVLISNINMIYYVCKINNLIKRIGKHKNHKKTSKHKRLQYKT